VNVASSQWKEEELQYRLEEASKLVKVGATYSHYRDLANRYKVLNLIIIEATQETGVMYQKESGSGFLNSVIWIRPVHSWIEKVPDNNESVIPRFQKKSM